jgi:hypothetical protein
MKRNLLLATTALLLSGCATTATREGMVYRDGSWYAPASDGRGDYYTSSPRREYGYGHAFDYRYDFSIGIVPYGGYCPVQYRWCTSYWGYYEPYWYQPWVYYQNPPRRPRHRREVAIEGGEAGPEVEPTLMPRGSEGRERTRPAGWEERPGAGTRSGRGEGRRRRGGTTDGGASGGP